MFYRCNQEIHWADSILQLTETTTAWITFTFERCEKRVKQGSLPPSLTFLALSASVGDERVFIALGYLPFPLDSVTVLRFMN